MDDSKPLKNYSNHRKIFIGSQWFLRWGVWFAGIFDVLMPLLYEAGAEASDGYNKASLIKPFSRGRNPSKA